MSRLFVTPRELNFISDITKEVIKDICGQAIYYFPISEVKSNVDEIYNEAVEKVFDNPIKIDALVGPPSGKTVINNFSADENWTIEVWLQYRDLVEKEINCTLGDMFSFGDVMYEITSVDYEGTVFGLPEHRLTVKLEGINARESTFKQNPLGPTDIKYTDVGSIQKDYEQQAGYTVNSEGETNDRRALIEAGLIESTETKPYKYPDNEQSEEKTREIESAFYDDDEDI